MNKKILIFIILLSLGIKLNAQIKVRENKVIEREIFKPKDFDSLTNIKLQKNPTDYKKFIGYKLFFLPKSKKYKTNSINKEEIIDFLFSEDTIEIQKKGIIPFEKTYFSTLYKSRKQYNQRKQEYENLKKIKTNTYLPKFYHQRTDKNSGKIFGEIGTIPDSLYGKYFTILDIKGKTSYKTNKFRKLENIDSDETKNWKLNLKITLRNDLNNDSLYWNVKQARFIGEPFFLVPYFEKQQKIYLNKNLVLKYKNRINYELENLIDVNTGEKVEIKYGEKWNCSDISFINSKDSKYLKFFYFLKNNKREVKISLDYGSIDYFMLESDFKKQELEKLKKEEQLLKEKQERKIKQEKERIKFKKDCIAKWGQKMGNYIANGKVVFGMTKEMCIASWGNPININRTLLKGLTSEQWVYGWGTYLYFENNKLNAIQD